MANEAQIRTSLVIAAQGNANPLYYDTKPGAFYANMSSSQGPTPGGLLCTVGGIVISLSALVTPGLAVFKHLGVDPLNYVELGVYNGVDFYPMLELLAGEVWPIRLARNLLQEFPGSSSTAGAVRSFYAKAALAAVNIQCDVFQL